MDVRFINPFVKSICNTFTTMCGIDVKVLRPTLPSNEMNANVSVIIGFSGDAAGSVIVKYSYDIASKVATAFAKTPIDQNHQDFADALGELANMIGGGAKAQFEGLRVHISLPSVIIGTHQHLPGSKKMPRLILPCRTVLGPFEIEVSMIVAHAPKTRHQAAATGAAL